MFKFRNLKDVPCPGWSLKILGWHTRYFSGQSKSIRSEINISKPFWLKVFRRNTIRICDRTI